MIRKSGHRFFGAIQLHGTFLTMLRAPDKIMRKRNNAIQSLWFDR
jgi:hypothetical protein